jgi:hypothetical protein
MSQDIEMHFCDLCGLSIPDRDLKEGLAQKLGEKTVGACCLAKLSSAKSATQPLPATRPSDGAGALGGGSTMLVGITVLLAAVLGSAWLVDARMESRQAEDRQQLETLLDARVEKIGERVSELREENAVIVREAMTGVRSQMQGDLSAIAKDVDKLIEESGKGIAGEKITGGLNRVQAALSDIATRQGLVEKTVAGLREVVDRRVAELGDEMRDLQRKASSGALGAASGAGTPAAQPAAASRFETLPDNLGRRVDQLSSSDPGRRWEAVDELVRSGDKRVLPYLVPVLKDADPYVRKLCVEGFGKLGEVSFAPALIDVLEDDAAIVREAAYRELVKLSGKKFPYDADASETRRKRAIDKWREWAKTIKS